MDELMSKYKSQGGFEFGEYTESIAFPASKEDLVAHARRKNLPPDVIERLEEMPDKTYNNISDVISEASKGFF